MVELVHDQRQIYTLQTGMVSPGFSQAVGAKVSSQSDLIADGSDELPGLTTANGFRKILLFCVEEKEMMGITGYLGISN